MTRKNFMSINNQRSVSSIEMKHKPRIINVKDQNTTKRNASKK